MSYGVRQSDVPRGKGGKRLALAALILLGGLTVWGFIRIAGTGGSPRAYFVAGRPASGEEIRTPLVASVQVQQHAGGRGTGRAVSFVFRLCDAEGREIDHLRVGRTRPDPPKVQVFNAVGQKVHSGGMEYG
jgi:hypothetical protein